jgi:hypothetical protein
VPLPPWNSVAKGVTGLSASFRRLLGRFANLDARLFFIAIGLAVFFTEPSCSITNRWVQVSKSLVKIPDHSLVTRRSSIKRAIC